GLAIGLSLALYPVLLLVSDWVGLHLGPLYAWLVLLPSLGVLGWRYLTRRPVAHRERWRWRDRLTDESLWADLAYVAVCTLVVFGRLFVVRSVDVPMWGDAYHHTMIAQLIADHSGLFNSWQPYAELETLTYHFGFHADVAVFHWLSGADLPMATLWTGQLINALAVIALYPLAVKVSGSRWAGAAAVFVAGLLSPMPMYYANWGRYTQLAGQAILPAAVWLSWVAFDATALKPRRLILCWLAVGGLALTHQRVLIFLLAFVTAYLISEANDKAHWVRKALNVVIVGSGSALLFLPWFVHIFAGRILVYVGRQVTTAADATPAFTQQYNAIGDLVAYLPAGVWLLLPVATGWGLWRKRREVAVIALWWFVVLLSANPQWLRLPGEGAISNFAVFIAAYIPAGVLVGGALGWVATAWAHERRGLYFASLLVIVVVAGIWADAQRLGDVNPSQFALVTKPDLQAAQWIRAQTPQNARFLVNSFFAYGDTLVVGSDGGWWLPLLARRQTTLPPITYGIEQGPRADYIEWVNALPRAIQAKGITHPDVLAMLRQRGVTHVYIGQLQGRVNYGGPVVLQPEQLLGSPNFKAIYHQDRVWVFEIVRPA
ncbi:MAG: hypothetical protein HYR71_00735, partial [Chloroflexi bacterium]|nr:hypothetical protein [Chloroflexota bacterium]